MKIGIFGGTFDPPHLAHRNVADSALQTEHIDKIIFIPAANPPHKTRSDITQEEDRLAMTRLLVQQNSNYLVSDIELKRNGPSYTITTLQELKQLYPEAELRLLIGADMALIFDTWKNAPEIIDIAPPLIAARPGYKFPHDFGTILPAGIPPSYRKILREGIFESQEINLSSTRIREKIKNKDIKGLTELIPQNVLSYIIKHNLYNINK